MDKDPIVAFQTVLEKTELVAESVIADGMLHRCGTIDKEHGTDGAYVLRLGDQARGWCKNYRTGMMGKWRASYNPISSSSDFAPAKRMPIRKENQQALGQRYADARKWATRWLLSCPPARNDHPYLTGKNIQSVGDIRQSSQGDLLLPIRNALGIVISLQTIGPTGKKRFLRGGQVRGGYFPIPGRDGTLYITEGYATGVSIHMATGETVLVAFCASNLKSVATMARALFPDRYIVLCADDDHKTASKYGKNPGLDYAMDAVRTISAHMAVPVFQDPTDKSDFNDLATAQGLDAVRACLAAAQSPQVGVEAPPHANSQSPLVALTAREFLSRELPKREFILDPVLPEQGLALLYAPRGLGKTFLALSIAYGVAIGKPVLTWNVPRPRNVLFVDGEMQAWMVQQRLSGIAIGYGTTPPDRLRLITPDCQPNFIPNLATQEGQTAFEPLLADVELLILDNLATLCRIGKENESESWLPVQSWILSLRKRGIAVILIHHANKNGGQRGTSSREDVMDTVIALHPPRWHKAKDGARFEVHVEKSRGISGEALAPFEAALLTEEGAFTWATRNLVADDLDKIATLYNVGCSVREIEKKTGIPRSTVQRKLGKLALKVKNDLPSDHPGQGVPVSQS